MQNYLRTLCQLFNLVNKDALNTIFSASYYQALLLLAIREYEYRIFSASIIIPYMIIDITAYAYQISYGIYVHCVTCVIKSNGLLRDS